MSGHHSIDPFLIWVLVLFVAVGAQAVGVWLLKHFSSGRDITTRLLYKMYLGGFVASGTSISYVVGGKEWPFNLSSVLSIPDLLGPIVGAIVLFWTVATFWAVASMAWEILHLRPPPKQAR